MTDQILHLLCAEEQVQVCAISAKELVSEAKEIHELSRVATAAFGRQLMMTSMMGSRLKNEEDRVSTIIKGEGGYAGTMICTAFPDGAVKGCVNNPKVELPPCEKTGKLDVAGYVGHTGKLTVVRDMGQGDPYVGVCNLISGEIAEDFAEYYTASEQQPSLVYLGVRVDAGTGAVRSAAGLLIQPLPGCDGEIVDKLVGYSEEIAKLSLRLDGGEELREAVETILRDLSPKTVLEMSPEYRCDCSRERIEAALVSVGREELEDMIRKDGGAEVKCHFCNKVYRFTEKELKELLLSAARMADNSDEEQE